MESKVSMDEKLAIYDIYILREGGIPIFAGCSTSDYCASHEGQHPLHTGFIQAIQNFGDEVFSSDIRNLKFETVKLNFKKVDSYTIVFVNPVWTRDEYISEKLSEVSTLLQDYYIDKIQEYNISESLYLKFMDDVVDLGLMAKDRVKLTRDIFKSGNTKEETTDTSEASEVEDLSIFARFKRKFESLIGR